MTEARYRISIKSQAGTIIGPENDAAAGALMLGTARAAKSLRCHALYLTRNAVVIETFVRLGVRITDFKPRLTTADVAPPLRGMETFSEDAGQPGSSVTRPFAGGRLVVLFTPGNATATAERLPGDDIADPTPKLGPGEVESMRLQAIE